MRFYKLTNHDNLHHGFQYQNGLNVDTIPFNPNGECEPGGLYFFNEVQLLEWDEYVRNPCYIWDVEIPTDALVYHEEGKSKASAIIITNCRPFSRHAPDYIDWENPEICLAAVKQDVWVLRHVKEQTPEICLAAVQQNGNALKYVKNQTPEICLAAVQQNGYAVEYVKEQTPEICMAAVQQIGMALEFVENQTPEICLAAVQQNGLVLVYVKEQTPELCLAAVQQNGYAVEYVKEQTPEICLAAVQQNGPLRYAWPQ
jgi:hypothetical protein